MALGWYNGWSPEERLATIPIQREAIRTGALTRPTSCSICGSLRNVWLHDERYDKPLEAYPICGACHRILHNRFDNPDPWLALVKAHQFDGCWFAQLSLDSHSQYRPYAETYTEEVRKNPGRV